jgi:uncharacterized protein with PIN domain
MMTAALQLHGDLVLLLKRRWRGVNPLVLPVDRSASIKDVIESLGIPHTEIDQILCNGVPTDFSRRVEPGQHYDLYPVPVPWDVTRPTLVRPCPLADIRFIVDRNVGRLARYLRMAGFDTLYDPRWEDCDLLHQLAAEPRLLLSRNLDLLKRKQVVFGRSIRANDPVGQLREVITLLGLQERAQPLSRCLNCNASLQPVAKQAVLHRLEPLTIRYFETFVQCTQCDQVYWPGSHVDRMYARLWAAHIRPRGTGLVRE